jgi:O-acetylserine/cysteine efflux transporter
VTNLAGMPAALPLRHILLALLTVTIWGSNFVAIKLALHDLPPLLLCTLRFLFVSLPLVFILPRPAVAWRKLLLYGLTMFALQFSFMFLGMKLGVSPGLASVMLQLQVFVTLALSVVFLRERITPAQIAGTLIAVAGFAVVAAHSGGEVSLAGLVCLLLAAVSWGYGNFMSRGLGKVNPLALVVWGGLVVPVPMGLASLALEGPAVVWHSLTHVGLSAGLALAFIVYASTLVGYSLWSWLLARHAASAITPFALLVPVFGMLSSALVLGEALPAWKLVAAGLVMTGLTVNIFGPRLLRLLPRPSLA